jgi:GT2 family glycosyltransferase
MLGTASILIVTYNHKNYLKACIESIQNQDYPHEIILIDNCSTDGTVEYVKENFPFVKVVESKKNLGYGAGNNVGVKYAKGEYVVILNPDTIVEKNWLKELIKPLEKGERLFTTPKILLFDGFAISGCGLVAHYTGLTFARGYLAKPCEFKKLEYVSCFSGACFAIRKKDFEELGGFDEKFFLYNDDSDLSWRAHLKGFKILYVPLSLIKHDAILKVLPEKMYYLEKGRYMIIRKYYSWKDFLLLLPSLMIVEALTLE